MNLMRLCEQIMMCFTNRGRNKGLDYNRDNGEYYVLYPNGEVSQRFCLDVAMDYRELFGGKIIRID
jgi:hypothetical protein